MAEGSQQEEGNGGSKRFKSQSAMEYLMTYGWAILIVAVVLGALYSLGIFNGSNFLGGTCIAAPGYLCSNPLLSTSGSLSFTYGYQGPNVTIVGFGCTNTTTAPSSFTSSGSSTLEPGQEESVSAACTLSSDTLGTQFSGYLWVEYDQAGQSDLIARFATINIVADKSALGLTVLATEQDNPRSINISNGYVYWVDYSIATIDRVPVSGGSNTVVASVAGSADPWAIAASGSYVYWADENLGNIAKFPIAGGSTTLLSSGQSSPNGLAISNGYIYWLDSGSGQVQDIPITGGSNVILATGTTGGYGGIAVSNGEVYWTASSSIDNVPITGGTPTVLAPGQSSPFGIAVSNGYVYWTDNTNPGVVNKVSISGGPVTTLASGQNDPQGIAISNGYVYWTDYGSGTINKEPINGNLNSYTLLATGQGQPYSIAASGGDIYWTTWGSTGNVMEIEG
jgi:hypothetical protein